MQMQIICISILHIFRSANSLHIFKSFDSQTSIDFHFTLQLSRKCAYILNVSHSVNDAFRQMATISWAARENIASNIFQLCCIEFSISATFQGKYLRKIVVFPNSESVCTCTCCINCGNLSCADKLTIFIFRCARRHQVIMLRATTFQFKMNGSMHMSGRQHEQFVVLIKSMATRNTHIPINYFHLESIKCHIL